MKLLRIRTLQWIPATLLAATVIGCGDPIEPMPALLWDAEFVSASGLRVTAAMVANQNTTLIGIGVESGDNAAQLGWAVRTGTCAGTGPRISAADAFPAITLNAQGSGSVETVINRRIAAGDDYAVELFNNPDGSGGILACGEFATAS